MSRVIVVGNCADCPHNERNWVDADIYAEWCNVKRREIGDEESVPFPAWCPLPKKEESDAKD